MRDGNRQFAVRLLLLLGISMEVSMTGVCGQSQAPRVAVTSAIEEDSILNLTLTVSSDAPISMYESDLPWGNAYSTVILAATVRGVPLQREAPIDDPGPSTRSLHNGQRLVGKIRLNDRFPELRRELRKNDVLIFWSYEGKTVDGRKLSRSGGWHALPMK